MNWKEHAKLLHEDEESFRRIASARSTRLSLKLRREKFAKEALRLIGLINEICPGAALSKSIKSGIVWTGEYLIQLSPSFADIRFGKPYSALMRKIDGKLGVVWSSYINKSWAVWKALVDVDERAEPAAVRLWYDTGWACARADEEPNGFLSQLSQQGRRLADEPQRAAFWLGYDEAISSGAGWDAHIAKKLKAHHAALDEAEGLSMAPLMAGAIPRPLTWSDDVVLLFKQFPNADDIRWERDRVYSFTDETTLDDDRLRLYSGYEACRTFDVLTGETSLITRLADFTAWKVAKWPQLGTLG